MSARKPPSLKIVAGTNRPDRDTETVVDLPLITDIPEAPNWLPNAHAVAEFDRLAAILVANKLLTEAGVMPLAHMCAAHGKIVQLYAAGEGPTASQQGTLRVMCNDFGLTPVSQGKVKSGGEGEKAGNRFARNGKKPAGA
jgi:phage terminase small subunit